VSPGQKAVREVIQALRYGVGVMQASWGPPCRRSPPPWRMIAWALRLMEGQCAAALGSSGCTGSAPRTSPRFRGPDILSVLPEARVGEWN